MNSIRNIICIAFIIGGFVIGLYWSFSVETLNPVVAMVALIISALMFVGGVTQYKKEKLIFCKNCEKK